MPRLVDISCRIVLADVATIVTGLFGALSINEYRWGYYVISCFFFLVVLAGLFGPGVQVRPRPYT